MEDLFGGDCNMFNPAATEYNDEDQPAGSQTLLQRAHGGTSCICCSGGPIGTSLLANNTDVPVAVDNPTLDDEQPSNEEGSCVRSSVAPNQQKIYHKSVGDRNYTTNQWVSESCTVNQWAWGSGLLTTRRCSPTINLGRQALRRGFCGERVAPEGTTTVV